jgi:cytochrome b involved in lipid metabolism
MYLYFVYASAIEIMHQVKNSTACRTEAKKPTRNTNVEQRIRPSISSLRSHYHVHHHANTNLFLAMRNTTLLLALIAANDSTSADRRDVPPNTLGVDASAETSLNNILRDVPERGKDIERTTVVAVESANKESRLAV